MNNLNSEEREALESEEKFNLMVQQNKAKMQKHLQNEE